jgi:hypothetical protein
LNSTAYLAKGPALLRLGGILVEAMLIATRNSTETQRIISRRSKSRDKEKKN